MTAEEFLAFYPQFEVAIPEVVLSACLEAANLRFTDFREDAPEARRLYTAHKLTLYARTVPAGSADAGASAAVRFAALASAGDSARITSERVDDVAVTRSAAAASSGAAASRLADLSETVYGLQLLALLRLHAYPRYVP